MQKRARENGETALSDPQWAAAVNLQNSGQLQDAKAAYRTILNAAPDRAEGYFNLGLIAVAEGDLHIALPMFAYAIQLRPKFAAAENAMGNAHLSLNRFGDAVECFRRAIRLAPGDAGFHFNLANALAASDRQALAEKAYRRALQIRADFPEASLNFGNLLRTGRRFHEALEQLENAVRCRPDYADAHNNIGNVLRDLDRFVDAEAAYRRAVAHRADYAIAHFNLGNVLRDQGRIAEAADSFRQAIKHKPDHGDAHRHLALSIRAEPDDSAIAGMKALLDDPKLPDRERMFVSFGLGKLLDDIGEYEEAFAYFRTGNRLKRATLSYNRRHDGAFADHIIRTIDEAFVRTHQSHGLGDETPVFIISMMRSGSTLLEQMLASHPEVSGGGELWTMPRLVDRRDAGKTDTYPACVAGKKKGWFLKIGDTYIRQIREQLGNEARFITDKMPQNFLYAGLIACVLKNSRFINIERNPIDTCLSIYMQLFTEGHPYAYDLEEIASYYAIYRRLMSHWEATIPNRIRHVRYDDLVEQPESTIRAMLDYCDLPFDARCLDFHKTKRSVKTASAAQVREKLYRGSLNRWKSYEPMLSQLLSALKRDGVIEAPA